MLDREWVSYVSIITNSINNITDTFVKSAKYGHVVALNNVERELLLMTRKQLFNKLDKVFNYRKGVSR
jgi:hypothetical protein